MNAKVLSPSDQEALLRFERAKVQNLEEMERSMLEWQAPWRIESLTHYLAQGWSYAIFDGEEISGYFLAQPLLFIEGHMQSLWLEHLAYSKEEDKENLLDIAYRTAREKHLQKLLFNQKLVEQSDLQQHKLVQEQNKYYSINTTKMSNTL